MSDTTPGCGSNSEARKRQAETVGRDAIHVKAHELAQVKAERDRLRAGIEELADEWEAAQAYNRAHMGQLTRDTPRPDDLRQLLADTHDVRDDLQREFGGGL